MIECCALLPVEQIAQEQGGLVSLIGVGPPEVDPRLVDKGVQPLSFTRDWVAIGIGPTGRSFLCIDSAPAKGGIEGQIILITTDGDERARGAATLADLLSVYFQQAKSGKLDLGE